MARSAGAGSALLWIALVCFSPKTWRIMCMRDIRSAAIHIPKALINRRLSSDAVETNT